MERNKRILIIDDQEDLREQLARLLVNCGRPNKTAAIVQSMRARLMGMDPVAEQSEPKNDSPAYDIDTAGQGEEAFEMVKAAIENGAPYAVMFTDLRMPPGWDGLKTAKKIREIDKNIEIVIMTAFADYEQEEISRIIGTPEKLLYIKKPFQAEEIFQLALSLTSKWNSEELERSRKKWLENLIRCMRKVKISANSKTLFSAALESLLNFTEAEKGLIASWSKSKKAWVLHDHRNIQEADAEKFLKDYSERLREASTIQKNFDGKYLIPLKAAEITAIVAVYDAQAENDPEWYKLMSLLVMVSNESLEAASFKDKNESAGTETAKLRDAVKAIKETAEKYLKTHKDEPEIKKIVEQSDSVLKE
ncbi:MAG: response regulator [Victivallaceae bacterium]